MDDTTAFPSTFQPSQFPGVASQPTTVATPAESNPESEPVRTRRKYTKRGERRTPVAGDQAPQKPREPRRAPARRAATPKRPKRNTSRPAKRPKSALGVPAMIALFSEIKPEDSAAVSRLWKILAQLSPAARERVLAILPRIFAAGQ